ncbi:hypothetical protein HW452_14240 [Halomonas aquamarina]|uniref:Uncharacterized protein n=1 Tax=Vreelandella aquamarina TaxID=77097 RepID=A0ACC5VXR6_9GAMM|nr:hypothetical protein [Halomonas aquamarina]MBZ5488683.1 hypothetical protein [Halomonas aquamarina]
MPACNKVPVDTGKSPTDASSQSADNPAFFSRKDACSRGWSKETAKANKELLARTPTQSFELALAANQDIDPLLQQQWAQLGMLEKQMLAASRYFHQQRLIFRSDMIGTSIG